MIHGSSGGQVASTTCVPAPSLPSWSMETSSPWNESRYAYLLHDNTPCAFHQIVATIQCGNNYVLNIFFSVPNPTVTAWRTWIFQLLADSLISPLYILHSRASTALMCTTSLWRWCTCPTARASCMVCRRSAYTNSWVLKLAISAYSNSCSNNLVISAHSNSCGNNLCHLRLRRCLGIFTGVIWCQHQAAPTPAGWGSPCAVYV
jgi:hypothetical protein